MFQTTAPPTITLNGAANVRVSIYSTYTDAGAYAADSLGRTLFIVVTGLPTDKNFTWSVTVDPIVVTYSALYDSTGSQSVIATRSITVYDPCAERSPKERTCQDTLKCSVSLSCDSAASALSDLISSSSKSLSSTASATAAAAAQFLTQDTSLPIIEILGQGANYVTADGSSGIIVNVTAGSVYSDPGATALKVPVNPNLPTINLTSNIAVTGLPINTVSTAVS